MSEDERKGLYEERQLLLIDIHKKRAEVDAALLAVGAIASGGPENALERMKEAEKLVNQYKALTERLEG